MALRDRINQDLKKAQQEKNELLVLVLRGLNAAFHNKEIEKRTRLSKEPSFVEATESKERFKKLEKESKLTEEEMIEVVFSEAKKRKESVVEFKKGDRTDLAKKEEKELEILRKYLPEQMGEEQIKEEAKKVIEEVGATGPQDTGKVMASLMAKLKGKAEGGVVSKVVADLLKKE